MNLQEHLKGDFKKNLTQKQAGELSKIKTPQALKSFIDANKSLFSSMENPPSGEELTNQFFEVLKDAKKIAFFKVFIGDLISSKVGDEFIKGKVVSQTNNKFTINHLSKGNIEVPKESSVKMFRGQKYDLRELNGLTSSNYSQKISTDSLSGSDRTKLLKGEETGVLDVSVKVNDKIIRKDKIKIKISKTKGKIYLNTIQAFEKKIYNKILPYETIKDLKAGKEIPMDFETKTGKTFTATVFWDKEMNGIRTKSTSEKKENLKSVSKEKNTENKKIDVFQKKEKLKKRGHKL